MKNKIIPGFQSAFFIITGIWPIIDITSFMAVTGPKTDIWLVRIFGAIITVIGIALGTATYRKEINISIIMMAGLSSLALAVADIFYVSTNVIPPVYLLDAIVEAGLAIFWLVFLLRYQ